MIFSTFICSTTTNTKMTTVLPITVSVEKQDETYTIRKYIVYFTSSLLAMVLMAGIVVFSYYMYTMNAPADVQWVDSKCNLTSIISVFNYTCEGKECVACSYDACEITSSNSVAVCEHITYNIQGKTCQNIGVYPCYHNTGTNHISSTHLEDRKAIDMVTVQFAITTIVIFGGLLSAGVVALIFIILQHAFKL
jgi:hypothetical protein